MVGDRANFAFEMATTSKMLRELLEIPLELDPAAGNQSLQVNRAAQKCHPRGSAGGGPAPAVEPRPGRPARAQAERNHRRLRASRERRLRRDQERGRHLCRRDPAGATIGARRPSAGSIRGACPASLYAWSHPCRPDTSEAVRSGIAAPCRRGRSGEPRLWRSPRQPLPARADRRVSRGQSRAALRSRIDPGDERNAAGDPAVRQRIAGARRSAVDGRSGIQGGPQHVYGRGPGSGRGPGGRRGARRRGGAASRADREGRLCHAVAPVSDRRHDEHGAPGGAALLGLGGGKPHLRGRL